MNSIITFLSFVCFLFLMVFFSSYSFREYISDLFRTKDKDNDSNNMSDYYGNHP